MLDNQYQYYTASRETLICDIWIKLYFVLNTQQGCGSITKQDCFLAAAQGSGLSANSSVSSILISTTIKKTTNQQTNLEKSHNFDFDFDFFFNKIPEHRYGTNNKSHCQLSNFANILSIFGHCQSGGNTSLHIVHTTPVNIVANELSIGRQYSLTLHWQAFTLAGNIIDAILPHLSIV